VPISMVSLSFGYVKLEPRVLLSGCKIVRTMCFRKWPYSDLGRGPLPRRHPRRPLEGSTPKISCPGPGHARNMRAAIAGVNGVPWSRRDLVRPSAARLHATFAADRTRSFDPFRIDLQHRGFVHHVAGALARRRELGDKARLPRGRSAAPQERGLGKPLDPIGASFRNNATAPCPARSPCPCLRSSASPRRRRLRWRQDDRPGRRGSRASRSYIPCRPNIAGRRSAGRAQVDRP
jgi:hypothetical protein